MANRLFSLFFAAAVACFALALRAERKAQITAPAPEKDIREEINIPGYSFSRN